MLSVVCGEAILLISKRTLPRLYARICAARRVLIAEAMTTTIRYVSLSLLASAAVSGCATDTDNTDNSNAVEAALSSAEQTAFNFFVNKGLSKVQSAGIIGNLMQESGVDPTAVEIGGGPGRGIAQWSVGGRWDTSPNDNVTAFASARGLSRLALNTQLDFIWFELTTFSGYGLSSLRAATTVTQAVTVFQDKFEICGTCDSSRRISFAQQALSAFGGSAGNALVSVHSGKCMDVTGDGTANGTNIELFSCNGRGSQAFQIVPIGSDVKLVHTHSGKCVDVKGSGTANGTNIQLFSCNGTAAQSFKMTHPSSGVATFVNTNSNKCVEVTGFSTADRTNIELFTCNGGTNQQWRVAAQ